MKIYDMTGIKVCGNKIVYSEKEIICPKKSLFARKRQLARQLRREYGGRVKIIAHPLE